MFTTLYQPLPDVHISGSWIDRKNDNERDFYTDLPIVKKSYWELSDSVPQFIKCASLTISLETKLNEGNARSRGQVSCWSFLIDQIVNWLKNENERDSHIKVSNIKLTWTKVIEWYITMS